MQFVLQLEAFAVALVLECSRLLEPAAVGIDTNTGLVENRLAVRRPQNRCSKLNCLPFAAFAVEEASQP